MIRERNKIVQQNMKEFEAKLFPAGNNIFSPDEFKILYLMFMMKNWNQGIYRDFISADNVIDILCITGDLEEFPEVFKARRVFAILWGTHLRILFEYEGKLLHKTIIRHNLGSKRI